MKFFRIFLRLPRWVLSGICFALICYLTLVPQPLPDNDIPFWEHTDKVVHAIMFGAMYFCLVLDLWRGAVKPPTLPAWLLTLPVIAFGGIVEAAQYLMGMGRGASYGYFAADIAGVILSLLLARALRPLGEGGAKP